MKEKIEQYKTKISEFSEHNQTVKKGKEYWGAQEKKKQKMILMVAAIVVVVPILVVSYLNFSAGTYAVLYPGIDTKETKEVMATLQELAIPTKTNEKGEVMVPKSQVDRLILDLSSQGFPKTAPAYGIFKDNAGFTTTEFEKKTMLLFNLQNNIQETLKEIEGVKRATVNIVVPDEKGYVLDNKKQKSTAAVNVTMNPGSKLLPAKVSSIKNLVSNSVPQMLPEDVVVVDANTGTTLQGEASQSAGTGLDFERLGFEREVENGIKEKIMNVMTLTYRPEDIRVSSTVVIDYDKMITEQVEYTPTENGAGVTSKLEEQYKPNLGNGGVVGEENNTDIPTYQDSNGDGKADNTEYQQKAEYLVSYLKQQVEKDKAILKDASIAVTVVDRNLSENKKENLLDSISKAANIPVDNISINNFDAAGGNRDVQTLAQQLLSNPALYGGIIGLLVLMAALLFMKKKGKKSAAVLEGVGSIPEGESDLALQQRLEEEKRKIREQAKANQPEISAATEDIRQFASQNPEITAQLIRTLLKDGEE